MNRFLRKTSFGLALVCACTPQPAGDTNAPSHAATAPSAATANADAGSDSNAGEMIDGTRVVKKYLHDATESSPLVIGLHGLGGSPERFSRVLADYDGAIELALIQGFFAEGSGFGWFNAHSADGEEKFAAAINASADRAWSVIEKVAHGRRVIVTGFSQGAMMTYALAARHPDQITYAFPIGGVLPHGMWPHDHARTAPVHALHGTADERIPIEWDRATVGAFAKNGSIADLREFPGVPHDLTPDIRADLKTHIFDVLAKSARDE